MLLEKRAEQKQLRQTEKETREQESAQSALTPVETAKKAPQELDSQSLETPDTVSANQPIVTKVEAKDLPEAYQKMMEAYSAKNTAPQKADKTATAQPATQAANSVKKETEKKEEAFSYLTRGECRARMRELMRSGDYKAWKEITAPCGISKKYSGEDAFKGLRGTH